MWKELFLFATVVSLALGFRMYQGRIPNGHSVPNPCDGGASIWEGVGHLVPQGGGARNPFGLAFAAAHHRWTADLCNADSDNDGVKNGVELGDPNCQWHSSTDNGILGQPTGHPGVCEPVDSARCAGTPVDCHGAPVG